MANLLRSFGYTVIGDCDDEAYIIRSGDTFPYFLDLCAANERRIIAIEIDGYKGHRNARQIQHDKNRTNEIISLVNHIECYRFAFWQLTPWDNDTQRAVLQEMQIQ